MKYIKSFLLLIILIAPISAHAVRLTLDDATTASLNPYTSNGYQLQGSLLDGTQIALTPNLGQSDTFNFEESYLSVTGSINNPATISLSSTTGSLFNLISIDLGSASSTKSANFSLSAINIVGDTISRAIIGLSTLQTVVLTEFIGITQLQITLFTFGGSEPVTSFSLDNIELNPITVGISPVPVPAAAWLFGSALLGFFGYSRRKRI